MEIEPQPLVFSDARGRSAEVGYDSQLRSYFARVTRSDVAGVLTLGRAEGALPDVDSLARRLRDYGVVLPSFTADALRARRDSASDPALDAARQAAAIAATDRGTSATPGRLSTSTAPSTQHHLPTRSNDLGR